MFRASVTREEHTKAREKNFETNPIDRLYLADFFMFNLLSQTCSCFNPIHLKNFGRTGEVLRGTIDYRSMSGDSSTIYQFSHDKPVIAGGPYVRRPFMHERPDWPVGSVQDEAWSG